MLFLDSEFTKSVLLLDFTEAEFTKSVLLLDCYRGGVHLPAEETNHSSHDAALLQT